MPNVALKKKAYNDSKVNQSKASYHPKITQKSTTKTLRELCNTDIAQAQIYIN